MYLIQISSIIKEKCVALKKVKMWNQKWWSRNGCDGKPMVNILITAIQVNLCFLLHVLLRFGTKFTRIVVMKILPLAYLHSNFLAAPWISLFFTMVFFRAAHFCLELRCFELDFVIEYCVARIFSLLLFACYLSICIGDNLRVYNVRIWFHFELKFRHTVVCHATQQATFLHV